jgi:hypothetical protein
MNILLVSDGNRSKQLLNRMERYFSTPDIRAVNILAGEKELLQQYLSETAGRCVILCDSFESKAFKETSTILRQFHLKTQAMMISGMDFLMLFKLYGLVDGMDFIMLRTIYESAAKNNIKIYPEKDDNDA